MTKKKASQSKKVVKIPFKWHIPENIITRFASNMVVQTLENEFKILFFEPNPEIHLDPSLPIPNEIQVNCVASVIVTANKLPQFIKVLQDQLDKHVARKQPQK